jgi:hypothetical protein
MRRRGACLTRVLQTNSGIRGIVPECAHSERMGRLSSLSAQARRPVPDAGEPVCGSFRFYVLMIDDETGVLRHASP